MIRPMKVNSQFPVNYYIKINTLKTKTKQRHMLMAKNDKQLSMLILNSPTADDNLTRDLTVFVT